MKDPPVETTLVRVCCFPGPAPGDNFLPPAAGLPGNVPKAAELQVEQFHIRCNKAVHRRSEAYLSKNTPATPAVPASPVRHQIASPSSAIVLPVAPACDPG